MIVIVNVLYFIDNDLYLILFFFNPNVVKLYKFIIGSKVGEEIVNEITIFELCYTNCKYYSR